MAYPTALELNERFRREVDDSLPVGDSSDDSDRLWKNVEVYGYLDEAQHALAKRTRALLYTFIAPVTAASPFVSLPSWVHDIQAVALVIGARTLVPYNRNSASNVTDDYNNSRASFSFSDTGTPKAYVADYVAKQLRLVPIPVATDTLEISAVTVPRSPLARDTDVCVFEDPEDLRLLLHFAKSLAYDKQDADVFDKTTADRYEAKFEAGAAKREQEINRLRRTPGTVRYNG